MMNWPSRGQKRKNQTAGEVQRCCYVSMLWGEKNQERLILEALLCGAHLQTHCHAQRILFVCGGMFYNPSVNLLRLVWQVRYCEHLKVSRYLEQSTHARLNGVWSKLQIGALLDGEFDVCAVVDTDMMAVQNLDEIFQFEVPAAVFRGTSTANLGARRPEWTYGSKEGHRKQIGGINGGLLVHRPSKEEYTALLKYLETYIVPSKGAEQDLMTDFWKDRYERGITPLPRSYNVQIHIIMMLGADQPQDSWYSILINNPQEQVKNWHFSADPKPVDFLWGSVDVKDDDVEASVPLWKTRTSSSSASRAPPWASGASHAKSRIKRSETKDPTELHRLASPWKTEHYVETEIQEMRSRLKRDRSSADEAPQELQDATAKVCHDACKSWEQSMVDNVWPNLVFAIHSEVKKRALDKETSVCSGCGENWSVSGESIEHNLFTCSSLDAAKRYRCRIDDDVQQALQKHPFAVPRGARRITQTMQYFGSVLEQWEEVTADRGKIAQCSRGALPLARPAESETALKQHMRTYKNTRRYIQRYTPRLQTITRLGRIELVCRRQRWRRRLQQKRWAWAALRSCLGNGAASRVTAFL